MSNLLGALTFIRILLGRAGVEQKPCPYVSSMCVDFFTNCCRVGTIDSCVGYTLISLSITFGRAVNLLGALTFIRILLSRAGIEQNPGPLDLFIFRYQYLLVEIGTDVIRKIFDVKVGKDFGKYLSANITAGKELQRLITANTITTDQAQHLPPIDNLPMSSNFDISLLACLLKNICGLHRHPVWKKPAPIDFSLEADLSRLHVCRNHLQHSTSVFKSETELNEKWTELSQILNRLNGISGIPNLSTLISTAENMVVDEELKRRYDQDLKVWTEMDILLDRGIVELKLGQSDMKEGQSKIILGLSKVRHDLFELKEDRPVLNFFLDNVERRQKEMSITQQGTQRQMDTIQQTSLDWKPNTRGMNESDIRNRLVNIYKEDCRTLPVSPLSEEDEVEVELLSIYKPPTLYHVPHHRSPQKEETYPISSYKELFNKDDCSFRKIYITGNAGVGKTSFCKRMTLLWCKAQSAETVSDRTVQNDIDFMAQFDFVFYVSLGETNRNDVVTMIVEQLFSIENDGKKNEMFESVENIIMKKECIIIMDAFDKWNPKESGKMNINKLFSDKCIFVTLCRPYKIVNERLSPQHIDRQVDMIGINKSSAEHYVREIVNHINKENEENKSPNDFIRDVKMCKLTELLQIPIIASHLVGVWFDNKLTNMSRTLIHGNIVDMLLKRAEKRKHIELLPSLAESVVQIPDPLSDLFYLKKHFLDLRKICLLSFNILCEQGKGFSDLVFTTEQLESEPYCITDKEIDFLCKFGILSKTKVICRFGKQEHKLSYLHKSYHEFFAALFVHSFDSNNAFDDVVKKWNTVNDVMKFEKFFLFFIGFSGKKSILMFKNIYHTISDDISSWRGNALSHNNDDSYEDQIKSQKTMIINCLEEISCSNDTILSFKLDYLNFGNKVISCNDNGPNNYDYEGYDDYNTDYDVFCPNNYDYDDNNNNDNDGNYLGTLLTDITMLVIILMMLMMNNYDVVAYSFDDLNFDVDFLNNSYLRNVNGYP